MGSQEVEHDWATFTSLYIYKLPASVLVRHLYFQTSKDAVNPFYSINLSDFCASQKKLFVSKGIM